MTHPVRLRCRLGWTATVEWAGLYLAQHDGVFAQLGLDVELLPGGPGHRGAARDVADGRADIGVASDLVDVLCAIGEGAPVRIVGATMPRSPLGLAWRPDAGIRTAADLVDRSLGAGTVADRRVLDAMLVANGLPARYTFTTIGHGFAELLAGEIDAMCCSTINQPPRARRHGHRIETATFADWGVPLAADVIVASEELLGTRPDTVARALAGIALGWERNAADPTRAAALAPTVLAGDDDALAEALVEGELQLPYVRTSTDPASPTLWCDEGDLDVSLGLLRRAGVGPLPARAAGALDLGPLRAASTHRSRGV